MKRHERIGDGIELALMDGRVVAGQIVRWCDKYGKTTTRKLATGAIIDIGDNPYAHNVNPKEVDWQER